MRQVVQCVKSGNTFLRDLPAPLAAPMQVIVGNAASVISAGTERYVVELAKKSLLGKARARPDHLRRLLQKVRQEGFLSTLSQTRAKLDEPMALGYSSAGFVLECGAGVQEFKPGDRVAIAAPHAEIVSVSKNLIARVPGGVSLEAAAYAPIGAIALEGVRLARVSLGERVLVIGLGLIGQLAVGLLKAQGCRVFGTDLDPAKLRLATEFGADQVAQGSPRDSVMSFSDSFGVDSVLITAATNSNEPIEFAAEVCRPKGRIVLVGVAGLNIPRPPFFEKELEFTVSSSMGPGRFDPQYAERGIDYPIGHARWTVQRNIQAVLEAIAEGRLPVEKLSSHRFSIENAADAYDLITTSKEPVLGIVLEYPEAEDQPSRTIRLQEGVAPGAGEVGVSMIGAGNFSRLIMMPILKGIEGLKYRGLCTARGLNAIHSGEKMGFEYATTDVEEILADKDTHAVFIMTRHNLHAEFVIKALRAGKHVFVEKPLCIKVEELEEVTRCIAELGDQCPILMVGFNRRFAPATKNLGGEFRGKGPLSVAFRFAPGPISVNAWPQDDEVGGGRIVGEACHAIDTCVALVGSPPLRVFAESVEKKGGLEVSDDRVFITIRHEDGSISNISYQAGGDKAGPKERIEVFGGGVTGTIEGWDQVEVWSGGKRRRSRGGKDKGHANELRAFLSACREGGPWPIPWEHLYGVTLASLMAVRSLREGRAIMLDEAEILF